MSTKNSLDSLEVAPTGGALGAEIRGVDLAQPMPEEVKEALQRRMDGASRSCCSAIRK